MDYKISNNIKQELNDTFYHFLNKVFNITIIDEYLYIYEEVFEHLLEDTERIFNKSYIYTKNIKFNKYVLQEKQTFLRTIFTKNMYNHNTLINDLRSDSKKFKSKIRKDKLNKINKK